MRKVRKAKRMVFIRPGIEIDNNTKFRTDDLRKFFRAILLEAGCDIREFWHISVIYVHERIHKGFVRGHAYLNSRNFEIKIPSIWGTIENSEPRLKQLAQIIHHEVDHCLGLEHSEMCASGAIVTTAWQGLQIRRQTEPKKITMDDRAAKREATARKKVIKLEREIKRKSKLLKKWKTKVRYYEKRAETAGERKMAAMNVARTRKPRPKIPRLEDGNMIIGIGSSLHTELWMCEVDTMSDRSDPPGRGEFVDAMEGAERKGRRHIHILTLNKTAKDYLVYSLEYWRGQFDGERAPLFRSACKVLDVIRELEPEPNEEKA